MTTLAREDPDHRWIRLLRLVAVGELVVFVGIMLLVRRQFIPPLAVASALFATGAALTVVRPRVGATAIGCVATLWLGSNIAFASQVVPDLLAVDVVEIFLPTFAMNILAATGLVGLVGVLRRARGVVAVTTQRVAIALVGVGTVVSVMAGLL